MLKLVKIQTLLLIHPRFSTKQSCVFQKRLETELMFVPQSVNRSNTASAGGSLWETQAQSFRSRRLNRVTALRLRTQRGDRSSPPAESLMCPHFFFCTSCSSFTAAVFFGSTLSRLFRSSTQALTSLSSL